MKTCHTCKQEKPESEYTVNRSLKDGLNRNCKECHRKLNNEAHHRRMNDPATREKNRKRLNNNYLKRKGVDTEWYEEQKQLSRDYRAAMSEGKRVNRCETSRLLKAYGITQPQRDSILEAQGGVCSICGEIPNPPCVDHDHSTGKVRGILCHSCNMGIGMFKDDPKRLSAAAAYLTKAISHTFSKVYVLTGAPGVGKSTLASKMADIFEVVEADKWTRDRHGMYDLIEKLAKQGGGKPVLVVQPFRSLTTIKLIEDRGITIKLVVLDIPAGEHLARLQSRRPSVTCLSDLVNKRRHRSRVYASNRSTVFCGDEARIEDYFRNTL